MLFMYYQLRNDIKFQSVAVDLQLQGASDTQRQEGRDGSYSSAKHFLPFFPLVSSFLAVRQTLVFLFCVCFFLGLSRGLPVIVRPLPVSVNSEWSSRRMPDPSRMLTSLVLSFFLDASVALLEL